MNRRDALKGLGLSLGYAVATPTIISLLQSCKTDNSSWTPLYLSNEEAVIIKNLIDLILPKTDSSPGALEVNVLEFIDLYIFKVYDEEGKKGYKEGIKSIMNALKVSDKNTAYDLKKSNYDFLLSKYLRASKEQQKEFKNNDNDIKLLNMLTQLRNTTVWSYRTSQNIGENVLAYNPVPGTQLGCITVEEATGGKRWSL